MHSSKLNVRDSPRLPLEDEPETRAARPTLDELRAKYGPTFGIRVDDEGEADRDEAELNARAAAKTEAAILAEYRRLGREPVYAGEVLISPALFKALGRPLEATP